MLTKSLITSQEAHQLVVDVLKKTNCSGNGVLKGYHENPFEGYVSANQVKQASIGKTLKLSTRQAFNEFREDKLKEVLKSALSAKDLQSKVKKTLKKHKIKSVWSIKKKHKPNPFEGYIGITNLYKAYKGEKLSREAMRNFKRYFRDN